MFNYVVVTGKYGKHYARAWKVADNQNLIGTFNMRNIAILHPTKTHKEAVALAAYWNECYKNNGTLQEF